MRPATGCVCDKSKFTKTNPTSGQTVMNNLSNRVLQKVLDSYDFTMDNTEALKILQEKTGLNDTHLQMRYKSKLYETLKQLEV